MIRPWMNITPSRTVALTIQKIRRCLYMIFRIQSINSLLLPFRKWPLRFALQNIRPSWISIEIRNAYSSLMSAIDPSSERCIVLLSDISRRQIMLVLPERRSLKKTSEAIHEPQPMYSVCQTTIRAVQEIQKHVFINT